MSDKLSINLPDLGEGLTNAEIITWHVAPGDYVVANQPLVAVETDKAIAEIPSPRSGRVARLGGDVGEHLTVGAMLLEFEADSARTDTGALVGQLATASDTPQPSPPAPAQRAPRSIEPQSTGRRANAPKASPKTATKATPAARRKATELGVDIRGIKGSGPGGVVQLADVINSASIPAADAAGIPLRGVRRAMAKRMADAHSRVVTATVTDVVDIDDWQASQPMPRLVHAIVAACRAAPQLHVAFDDERIRLISLTQIDLGIAMQTDEGLFVPVLRDAGQYRSAVELAHALAALAAAVHDRAITTEQMRGQSITLSNYGAVGGRFATMVVVPPQVAIVGAGRIFDRMALTSGVPVARRTLPLSLTFDHRVVTGVEACRFMSAMIEDLHKPTSLV